MQFVTIALALVGRTLVGAIITPLAVLLLMLVIVAFDKSCGGPGDSGGCAMGVASVAMLAVPVGALLGLAYGIWRAVKRARQQPVSPDSAP